MKEAFGRSSLQAHKELSADLPPTFARKTKMLKEKEQKVLLNKPPNPDFTLACEVLWNNAEFIWSHTC
jgi:hypothetical protein